MSYVATTRRDHGRDGPRPDGRIRRAPLRRRALERRRTPIEWLSDNGPPYTAHETREFGEALGLLVCTTPAYSPESNGMAESFVKTFKRDYVYLNELRRRAPASCGSSQRWFEDYNEVHPHKGLRMQSPREYRRATANA